MTLNEYQEAAVLTLQGEVGDEASTLIALLGLAGETGELSTLYKKFLRDGPSFEPVNERLLEELGDVLWYVSTLCSHFRLDLSEVASANLAKTASRWTPSNSVTFSSLDENFTESERLPRIFAADFKICTPRSSKIRSIYRRSKVREHTDGQLVCQRRLSLSRPLAPELCDRFRLVTSSKSTFASETKEFSHRRRSRRRRPSSRN